MNNFFSRFFDGECFQEELLCLIGLEGDTTGRTLCNALTEKLTEHGVELSKCIAITTDGAPAMVGRDQRLVARLKQKQPLLLGFHCIIHQSVLCGKLSAEFQALMTKMINFLKAKSALRHRRLRSHPRRFRHRRGKSRRCSIQLILAHIQRRWRGRVGRTARRRLFLFDFRFR